MRISPVVLDSSAVVERECDVRATSSGNLEEIKPLCLFLFLACLFRGVGGVTAALALWLSLIDAFWENPYAFSMLAHHRYPEDTIQMFAGRWTKKLLYPVFWRCFGIKVEDTDIMRQNFQTLRGLIKFIETKHS